MGDDTTGTGVRPARSSVLRLRGLPFQATESDIEEFFTGYDLKQCQICKRNGRSTGEAYVQLETEAVAGQALQELNCKHMGRRYIEIFEASESDLSPGLEGKGVLGYVLRLRGLPYSATRSDVEKFFESVQIYKGEEGVVFSVTSSGRPTGEAYVEFMSEEAQQDAMKRHKQHMGSRYIELFKSTKADLLQALQQNRFYKEQAERRQWLAQNVPTIPADSTGLRSPYNPAGQVEDVTKFLQSLSVNQQNYQVMPGAQDPSGGYQNYEGQQEAAGGQDESGHYGPRDAHQNYVDSPHYPSGPGPPVGQMSNSAHHYHGGGRGRMGAGHQAPPGVQPGQQMVPHDMMMMQQHYLMQQHMMQQQQLVGGQNNDSTNPQQEIPSPEAPPIPSSTQPTHPQPSSPSHHPKQNANHVTTPPPPPPAPQSSLSIEPSDWVVVTQATAAPQSYPSEGFASRNVDLFGEDFCHAVISRGVDGFAQMSAADRMGGLPNDVWSVSLSDEPEYHCRNDEGGPDKMNMWPWSNMWSLGESGSQCGF